MSHAGTYSAFSQFLIDYENMAWRDGRPLTRTDTGFSFTSRWETERTFAAPAAMLDELEQLADLAFSNPEIDRSKWSDQIVRELAEHRPDILRQAEGEDWMIPDRPECVRAYGHQVGRVTLSERELRFLDGEAYGRALLGESCTRMHLAGEWMLVHDTTLDEQHTYTMPEQHERTDFGTSHWYWPAALMRAFARSHPDVLRHVASSGLWAVPESEFTAWASQEITEGWADAQLLACFDMAGFTSWARESEFDQVETDDGIWLVSRWDIEQSRDTYERAVGQSMEDGALPQDRWTDALIVAAADTCPELLQDQEEACAVRADQAFDWLQSDAPDLTAEQVRRELARYIELEADGMHWLAWCDRVLHPRARV
jgi:hypothetical protein